MMVCGKFFYYITRLDDKSHGEGRIIYANGDVYEGNWENDLPNGEGVMSYFNGNKYDGQWSDGV